MMGIIPVAVKLESVAMSFVKAISTSRIVPQPAFMRTGTLYEESRVVP